MKTVTQIFDELLSDMNRLAGVAKPYSDRWNRQRDELERLHKEASEDQRRQLEEAARNLSKTLHGFD